MRISPFTLLFRALVALVAVVVLAAGCSSDNEPTDAGSGSDDSSDAETSTDDDGSDDSGSDDATSDDESTDGDSDMEEEDPEPVADMSASVAIYCEANALNDAAADNIDPADPESVRNWVFKSRDALRDVIPQAPEEIRGDLAILFEGFEQFIVILESYEFDFFAALPEIEALTESPAQAAADEHLDAWEAANCPTGSVDTGEDAAGGSAFEDALATPEVFLAMIESEGGRELILDGMTEDGDFTRDQAECLIDHPDFLEFFALIGGAPPSADIIPTIIGVFTECGIDLQSLGG